jgi:biuret amidohydrolase
MELQNGVVGVDALIQSLPAAVAANGMLAVAGSLCRTARAHGIRVVHCTAESRPDGAGSAVNCRIFGLSEKRRLATDGGPTDIGTRGARVVDELDEQPSDITVARLHGMSPFMSTSLDQILRNLGVRTIVLTGVSVNLGIFGAAMSAVDLGYQVVLPTDAVAGIPDDYAQAVIANSLSLLTTLTTSSDVIEAWSTGSGQ